MLDTFETCPKKWHDKYILKNKEPESEALRYGNHVHKSIEKYLKGETVDTAGIPGMNLVESVKSQFSSGFAELGVGVTEELKPTEFFSKNVFGRGKADAVILGNSNSALCADWKTGKKREKEDQLKILSLFLFKKFPDLKKVVGCNMWLELGEVGEIFTFHKENEGQMWADLLKRLQPMYNAVGTSNAEVMKPSYLCGYCPVKSCRFNKT